jgi:ribosome-interacting GTPase 1
MVLNSTNVALITHHRLDDLNDEIYDDAVVIRVMTHPLDQDTDSEDICEHRIRRL